ncbi:hypothetical protein CAPTEDRAFT_188690 [Capitella teleta]|uniref:Apple domain-containing protein n=1 Tax=Capitella teleta TaxID=283909 RepID=R7T8C6_CAPTE|nr:hypothetical protein CAPTEDRAFT_188690 [Capitella teleta]|eukprot:ELT89934.1 hypothetical protein CAPTEDRAFT_188690 [Capitella teleta]
MRVVPVILVAERKLRFSQLFACEGFPPDGYNAQPTVGDQTQDCVELRNTFYDSRIKGYSNAGRHYWNDATCSADKNFICKVKRIENGKPVFCPALMDQYNVGAVSGFKGVPGVALSDDARSAYGCIIKRHEFSTTTEMVLKTVVGGTQVGCFMRCLSHVSCESANYDSSAHSCQLISVSAESLSELISAQESVYLSTDLC